MEKEAVVEIFPGQEYKVVDGLRGVLRVELQNDFPSGRSYAGQVILFTVNGHGRLIFPLFGGHGTLLVIFSGSGDFIQEPDYFLLSHTCHVSCNIWLSV
jgi:hypothetical protein